jgi:hypothetical protein
VNRRFVAWLLIAYGVLGLGVLASGAVIGLDAAGRLEGTADRASRTLDAAERSIRAAAGSFSGIDASLAEAEGSAQAAADLARDAGGTLRSLSSAMQLSIFGTQPLASLGDEFATSAEEADALAISLDGVSSSLGDTRPDIAGIGSELETLADELAELGSSTADAGPLHLRLFLGILLAWLVVPAIGALVVGIGMLRREAVAADDPI